MRNIFKKNKKNKKDLNQIDLGKNVLQNKIVDFNNDKTKETNDFVENFQDFASVINGVPFIKWDKIMESDFSKYKDQIEEEVFLKGLNTQTKSIPLDKIVSTKDSKNIYLGAISPSSLFSDIPFKNQAPIGILKGKTLNKKISKFTIYKQIPSKLIGVIPLNYEENGIFFIGVHKRPFDFFYRLLNKVISILVAVYIIYILIQSFN